MPLTKTKCEYCSTPAVPFVMMGMEICRWCSECQQDLREFAKIEAPKGMPIDTSDETAVSKYRAEMQRRENDFMRQKIKKRKSQ